MSGKPDDAWWDAKNSEWVYGARDPQGRLVGLVRYWNADGALISDCEHVDGKPHGRARRYYANGELAQVCTYIEGVIDGVRQFLRPTDATIELPRQLGDADEAVIAYECVYELGDLIGTRWRDGRGREVDQRGRTIGKRPAALPPTATPIGSDGWVWMRRAGEDGGAMKEMREYYKSGALRSESIYSDGTDRGYYKNGQLKYTGVRNRIGARHHQIGAWQHYDAKGRLRRVSEYEAGEERRRTWHRTATEAKGGGITREGPIADRVAEVGLWIVRDAVGAVVEKVELGARLTDAELLAHPVTEEELDDAIGSPNDRDRDLVTMLARVRRAGRDGDVAGLRLSKTPAWRVLDEDTGKLTSIFEDRRYDSRLRTLVHAIRWGPPDGEILALLAAELFRGDRAHAALDTIDAALAIRHDAKWVTARAGYLRAIGRTDEAEAEIAAQPGRVDERALELLEEIRNHPADDGVRLVFADHIAPQFPAHTALIVAQCANRLADPSTLVDAFIATLPEWMRSSAAKPVRGFVEEMYYVSAKDFVEGDPDTLLRIAPTDRRLHLEYASGHIAQLVTMPALRRYTELSFSDTYLFGGRATQLARCPHLGQLRHFGLHATNLADEDLLAILQSPGYPRLEGLEIGNGREEQDYRLPAFRALADAAFAPTLKRLGFERRWMGDEAIEVLAKLPALTSLGMKGSSISDVGALLLAELPIRIEYLDLDHNDIGPEGAAALAASPALSTLESLHIKTNPLGSGAITIARSKNLKRLEHLEINGDDQRVGPEFAEALASGPLATTLVHLEMSLGAIGPAGGQALSRATFPKLHSLNLHNNAIGDAGVTAIAGSPWMKTIRALDVSGCNVSDVGALALIAVESTHPDLWIELGGAKVSARVKKQLFARFGDRVQLEYPWNRH